MKNLIDENLRKKIKREIYGKPHVVSIAYPAGMSDIVCKEINSILENLWFPQKYVSNLSVTKKEIRIDNIHMSAITELLMRSQCITDIRLMMFEGKIQTKSEFVRKTKAIQWQYFIASTMVLKIKMSSIPGKILNSTILKKILSDLLKQQVKKIVKGENAHETTCVYVDFFEKRAAISISLAGEKLYKRGYRGVLSASAPLREDAASCCIQKALAFAKQENATFLPDTVFVPFSGTGTFAFEYLQFCFRFSPVLFGREYALKQMPLFRSESFNFLTKKALEHCFFPISGLLTENQNIPHAMHFICVDHSNEANVAFLDNLTIFENAAKKNNFIFPTELISQLNENFFKLDIETLFSADHFGNIFMPINPPYGIRFAKQGNTIALYKSLAQKINEISKCVIKTKKNLFGFILCPSEEAWSSFCRNLLGAKIETYHFTQGGMDIRVCQFIVVSAAPAAVVT